MAIFDCSSYQVFRPTAVMKIFSVLLLIFIYASSSAISGRLPGSAEVTQGRVLAAASQPVRAVNFGGWLLIERWMKPSLFDGITNPDLLDGAQIQLRSVKLGTYVSAEGGGGGNLVVNRQSPSGWETFRLWRVSSSKFQLRVFNNQFVKAENGGGGLIDATTNNPSTWETFEIESNDKLVHLKALNGQFLQAKDQNQLTADYDGQPGWDNNAAVFEMTILASAALGGEYQLANGLDRSTALKVFKEHRDNFVTDQDFSFLASKKINAVRIPVGWWIADDPNPPFPFVPGSLQALDNAFKWGRLYGVKIIVDLHGAPGSQNPWEHSGTRDGVSEWTMSENIAKTLKVIDFLANRYKNDPALLGIELLNEPRAENVPLDVLTKYYRDGYDTVRKHTSSAYVIFCQRIGGDPVELVNIMQPSSGYSNVVLDIHLYNLFSSEFDNKSVQWHIDYVNKERQQKIKDLNNAGGASIFVGEWTNEWNVNGASDADYTRFGAAQLAVYGEASFGWAYWSLMNVNPHWDFRQSVNKGYLSNITP